MNLYYPQTYAHTVINPYIQTPSQIKKHAVGAIVTILFIEKDFVDFIIGMNMLNPSNIYTLHLAYIEKEMCNYETKRRFNGINI